MSYETSPTLFGTNTGYGTGLPACMPADDESRTDVIDILHAHAPGLCMRYTEQKCANGARVADDIEAITAIQ